jgi:hypothetical protein
MGKQLTASDVRDRVKWEGGVLDAVEYGIRHDQIQDPALRTMWRDVESRYKALTPLTERIRTFLEGGIPDSPIGSYSPPEPT